MVKIQATSAQTNLKYHSKVGKVKQKLSGKAGVQTSVAQAANFRKSGANAVTKLPVQALSSADMYSNIVKTYRANCKSILEKNLVGNIVLEDSNSSIAVPINSIASWVSTHKCPLESSYVVENIDIEKNANLGKEKKSKREKEKTPASKDMFIDQGISITKLLTERTRATRKKQPKNDSDINYANEKQSSVEIIQSGFKFPRPLSSRDSVTLTKLRFKRKMQSDHAQCQRALYGTKIRTEIVQRNELDKYEYDNEKFDKTEFEKAARLKSENLLKTIEFRERLEPLMRIGHIGIKVLVVLGVFALVLISILTQYDNIF